MLVTSFNVHIMIFSLLYQVHSWELRGVFLIKKILSFKFLLIKISCNSAQFAVVAIYLLGIYYILC